MDVIEWWAPLLICIGSDFSKFDEPAIKQKSLETLSWYATGCLVMIFCYWDFWPRYQPKLIDEKRSKPRKLHTYKTNTELLADASSELTALSADLDGFLLNMGMMWPKKNLDFNLLLNGLKVSPVWRQNHKLALCGYTLRLTRKASSLTRDSTVVWAPSVTTGRGIWNWRGVSRRIGKSQRVI